MLFTEFLSLVKVMRMLYGVEIAEKFFTKNIELYYDLNSDGLKVKKNTILETE